MASTNGKAPEGDLLKLRYIRIQTDDEGNRRRYRSRASRVDLVGTAEAALILGVERPRIGRWLAKGVMPMPVVWLAAGPVWLRKDIQAMVREVNERKRSLKA